MSYFLDASLLKRNRNFALLYMGQFISFVGSRITDVALPYQIYTETHSTLMVGLLSLAQIAPLIFTALVGGVFADRYHRRMLLLVSELMLCCGSIALAFNAQLASPHIWVLFLVSTLMSAFNGLHRPALESLLQQIVDRKDFNAVSTLRSFQGNFGMIGGPALGGLIIAHFGIVMTYWTDVISFAASLLCIILMTHIPKPEGKHDDSTWASLKQGCKFAFSKQELLGSYIVDIIAMIFGMPMALFPAIAMTFGGAKALGILYSAPAVGAVVVSFVSGWTASVKRHGAAIAISAILWGVAIIFFGISSNFWVAIFFLALAGAADAVSGIFRQTMWSEVIPNHLRGRLAGIEMISYLSGPKIGDAEAGLVAAVFGITASVVSGGVLCVVGVAISCLYLPKFWDYVSKEPRIAED